MARFTETVNIQQAPDLGPVDTSLGDRLTSFSQQLQSIQAQKVQQRSLAEGRAAFKEGEDPEFKEEKFFGSIGSKAYNQGLRASYIASVDRDNREEVARIAAENPTNLAGYNDAVESYKNATLTNIDPSARQIVSDSMESLISANRIRVQTQEIKATHEANDTETADHVESAVSDALRFAGDGDDISSAESMLAAFQSIDGRVAAGFMSSEEAVIQKREINKDSVESKHMGGMLRTFDDVSPQAAYDKLDDLSDSVPGGFAPDEWNKFIGKAQSQLNQKLSRQEKLLKGQAKEFEKGLEFDKIKRRIDGDDSIVMNPKMVDLYYQEIVSPSLEGEPTEVRQAKQADFMDRTKVLPNTLKQQIVNGANSNNPELITEAASLVDRIDEIPAVINSVPTGQQAYLLNVVNLLPNMTEAEAIQTARAATDPKDKPRIDAAKEFLKVFRKDNPEFNQSSAIDAFDPGFFSSPPEADSVNTARMGKEYGDMFDAFVLAGATEGDAKLKADKMIRRDWGITNALGTERIMKYPMERYYSINGDISYIKKQLMRDVNENTFTEMGIKADDVILMSSELTARTASTGQPQYAVKALINGSFINLGNWKPDQAAEVERLKEMNVRAAREERKRKLEGRIGIDDLSEIGMAL